ncbi:MAG TPA: type II secretion system F family protein [Trinickia sp.]|jgi:Flp pilus assembly protein TadB|uniref:type II secretion system F family protein n=1 Tax=Trinickia sp. TaxID=2571163 RepID=UPI002BEDB001|nr:type II secretion system F family protein [Trinickia sp.]HTI18948.1 type II secretion system F family protein [Trinickia sp.]
MTPADVVAAGSFFAIVVAGLILRALRQIARERPVARIKTRVATMRDPRQTGKPQRDDTEQRELFHSTRRAGDKAVLAAFSRWQEHVQTVGGKSGMRTIGFGAAAAFVASFIGASFLSLAPVLKIAASIGIALFAVRGAYVWMVARFRQRFLNVFPDTLDLIIRAVRAGIPVVQAICTAGTESEEPVRATFRTMGDALLVGAELKDVLEEAARRLQLADFSFFSVCLILQRETGGNLGDTLENLATIVRTRRDIRAKSKALTAEGRLASKMIASVPFAIMGFMYVSNRPYLQVLTTTHAGHKVLVVAAVLMVVGLLMIRKISNLDTSR